MKRLSIVVPCYNEEACVQIFYDTTSEIVRQLDVETEFIFVDDGSKDNTLNIFRTLASQHSDVKYVSLSRNFGKEAAIYAGLKKASGDYLALMDVDLQDPPSLLLDMYRGITEEGYDCVASKRANRKHEPVIRSLFARMFYRIVNKMTDTEIVSGARDYRMMTRQMVNAILSLSEVDRFSKELFSWVGFKTKWLKYPNIKRVKGKTKWNFKKLTKYAVSGIESATTAPLKINFTLSVLFLLASLAFVGIDIAFAILNKPVSDLFIILPVVLFGFSVVLFGIFIISQYIGKIFKQVRGRPIYIAKEDEQIYLSELKASQDSDVNDNSEKENNC